MYNNIQMKIGPQGAQAARLQRRKTQLSARLRLPLHALPGFLAQTHRRCGKPSCHCADGPGHSLWLLTFMVEGEKRVEHIPEGWVEGVRQGVEAGRKFKEAVAQIWTTNAELLVLWRKQQRGRNRRR